MTRPARTRYEWFVGHPCRDRAHAIKCSNAMNKDGYNTSVIRRLPVRRSGKQGKKKT